MGGKLVAITHHPVVYTACVYSTAIATVYSYVIISLPIHGVITTYLSAKFARHCRIGFVHTYATVYMHGLQISKYSKYMTIQAKTTLVHTSH